LRSRRGPQRRRLHLGLQLGRHELAVVEQEQPVDLAVFAVVVLVLGQRQHQLAVVLVVSCRLAVVALEQLERRQRLDLEPVVERYDEEAIKPSKAG
jgi:hypothetical protein